MSHTNSTPNYNLPQFVGTDKPTWLNDVNGAMSAIDTQMKANADSATTAGTSATTANNAIGTLANLETTAKTDLVSAVNEVNTNVTTVGNVASQASANATSASGVTVESNDLGFRPESDITVNGIATKFGSTINSTLDVTDLTTLSITFKTNGKIQFNLSPYWYNRTFSINLYACMVFLKNFGDTPENA